MSETKPPEGYQWLQHYALRLREGFRFVVEAGRPVTRAEVLEHVEAADAPIGWEREQVSNG